MLKLALSFIFAIMAVSIAAMAQDSERKSSIGYPTVAAALSDLMRRNDVEKSVQRGWTIIADPAARSLWSFTPPSHPAHPAAIVRTITERNGAVHVDMKALCQAEKAPCDRRIAEFKVLNESIKASQQRGPLERPWQAGKDHEARAVALLDRFLAALDGKRFHEAYELLAPDMQAVMSLDRYAAIRAKLAEIAGGTVVRGNRRITWYKDPPRAKPGVFAAFDIACTASKHSYCEEVVILHEPPGGRFRVLRHETNFVDPETRRRLPQRREQ